MLHSDGGDLFIRDAFALILHFQEQTLRRAGKAIVAALGGLRMMRNTRPPLERREAVVGCCDANEDEPVSGSIRCGADSGCPFILPERLTNASRRLAVGGYEIHLRRRPVCSQVKNVPVVVGEYWRLRLLGF